jgi:serine/threonine protein kinase
MDLSKNSEEQRNKNPIDPSCSTNNSTENLQNSTKNIPKKMTITDFKVIRNLGKGAYAKVISVKNIHTGKNYAIKVIDKTFIEREEKVEQVHIEKQLLSLFEHPNIIKLYSTFQNKKKLYFVLELAERGDLKEFITTQRKQVQLK